MVKLISKNFEIGDAKYLVEIISRVGNDGYNLNFEVVFKNNDSNNIIFQTICGDWKSAKDVVDMCFHKMGELLDVDPNTIERARDGFLKN